MKIITKRQEEVEKEERDCIFRHKLFLMGCTVHERTAGEWSDKIDPTGVMPDRSREIELIAQDILEADYIIE